MPNRETSMSLPLGWTDDSLSSFVDQAFKNTLATFVRMRPATGILIEIDRSFLRVGQNLHHPPDFMGALLFLRSHSAFRAGCRMSMSGQVPDAFPSMRACLEYALYALHIHCNPKSGGIWMNRQDDNKSRGACRREFEHSNVVGTLCGKDKRLGVIVEQLYQRTIDFGGHPNERAIMGSMKMASDNNRIELAQIYLHGDSLSLKHALKTTAQIGLGSLCIFNLLFKERFELLGIRQVIDRLQTEL